MPLIDVVLEMKYKPHYYQQEGLDALIKYYRAGNKGHPLLAYPTGSGKTIIIAIIIEHVLMKKNDIKIIVISHVKEIVKQDYDSLSNHLPDLNIGLYSAGLKKKNIQQVTIAGIQSLVRNLPRVEDADIIIVDEAHTISPRENSSYQKVFAAAKKARIIGLTATPFRLGQGYIFGQKDSVFSDMIIDYTQGAKFNQLVSEGYLCQLKSISTEFRMNTKGLHTRGGDFIESEMSIAYNRKQITKAICDELMRIGQNYKKWLIFTIDIDHAENVAEYLLQHGIPTNVVHSKMEGNRDKIINDFKSDVYTALTNVNILTTGFDHPEIDLIAILRPTQSPVFHVQMIGRGLRKAIGKDHCIVLDFAGNISRLGPVNDVRPHIPTQKGGGGEPITKECPKCNPTTIHHPRIKICPHCGYKFPIMHNLDNASGAAVISGGANWHSVDGVEYNIHSKVGMPNSLKVTYTCGLRKFNEWVCIEHQGWAGRKGKHWAKIRGADEDVTKAEDLIAIQDILKVPKQILVKELKYPEILKYDF